jgi:two-component system NarL family sensor kinase
LELDDLGLVAALRSYCEDFATREGIAVELESRGIPGKLRREIGSCVYKVAQESLNNVAKHAAAERVSVILDGTEESIRLRVKDSGVGFSVGPAGARVGLGLLSMEERVGLLRGSLRIRSQPGQGTEVIAHVPLEAP